MDKPIQFQSIDDVVKHWEEMSVLLEKLLMNVDMHDDDMFCIITSRKNQILECIADIKSII